MPSVTALRPAVLRSLLAVVLAAVLAGAVVGVDPPRQREAARLAQGSERELERATIPTEHRVLVVTVDGLRSSALVDLAEDLPTFARLRAEGAGTLRARTSVERTETLPNHTGMVTGRRVVAARGGHGVTWNEDLPGRTVQQAAGERVGSVFSRLHAAGGTTALFTGKSKLSLFKRSWPRGVDRFTLDEDTAALVRKARRDLRRNARTFTFLHLSDPDVAGHAHGWGSEEYAEAVRDVDGHLAAVLATVEADPVLSEQLTLLLTADHGGSGTGHFDASVPAHYRVPFLTWGRGTAAGADLYALNTERRDPRARRPGYAAGRQPVRNLDVANLALDLLGVGAVPGSEVGVDQELDLR